MGQNFPFRTAHGSDCRTKAKRRSIGYITISKKKNRTVNVAVNQNWIRDMNMCHENYSSQHFHEFTITLLRVVQDIQLVEHMITYYGKTQVRNYTKKNRHTMHTLLVRHPRTLKPYYMAALGLTELQAFSLVN